MAEIIEPGTKVKYQHLGEWKDGVVHAVKTHVDNDGIPTYIGYQIDTGNDLFVNEIEHSVRNQEINKRVAKLMEKESVKPHHGKKYRDVLHKHQNDVMQHTDLPHEDERHIEKIRQPEQIEVDQNFVKVV